MMHWSVVGTNQPVVMTRVSPHVTCGSSVLYTRTSHRVVSVRSNESFFTNRMMMVSGGHSTLTGSLKGTTTCCHSASPDRGDDGDDPSTTPKNVVSEMEEPIWVRRERERELAKQEGKKDLPFGLYLLLSSIVAIAAVGSIFEFANKNPIFDIVYPDSPLYTPILGLFSVTGIPTAGYLFFKAVGAANAEAERMDKLDGVESKDNYFNRRE